ncbi:protein LAZY 1-like isoform X1 [Zingiber officinale]|uniref:protein LAZY 1-like isoform X1 n=1 Tax=Zingiber officinale TaxID=94328 RepID=UPI001C4A872F|nr:protein LAZY 1-like isoform X1 [Zingiber officinale]
MKLLGWMHRKLWPNNGGDGFKDFGGGGACICIGGRTSPDGDLHRCRRREYEPFHARARGLGPDAEELYEGGGGGEPAVEEIFEGFLAIGTLGIGSWPIEEEDEASIEEAQKESAGGEELVVVRAALETIAEKEAEATTKTDLMVVETELEKVLAAEAERDRGRRSSAARSSHAGSSSSAAAACPLQGFLFGSSSEAAGAIEAEAADATVAGSSRKAQRTSLAELFMMSRIAEEAAGREKASAGVGNAADWEEKATSEIQLLTKRMTKRRGWKGSDGADAADGLTAETTIQKILQMFHRKVHPQNTNSTRRSCKTGKIEKKHYVPLIGGKAMKLKDERRKEIIDNLSGSDMNVDQGHWIKTDANYVVLEL